MNDETPMETTALDARLAALPRELPPARDLWPAIDAATRPAAPRRYRWLLALAAGFALAALGAVVGARLAAPPAIVAAGSGSGTGDVGTRHETRGDAQLVATRAALEQTYRERLALLSPATRAEIEHDLHLIQSAQEDIRRALGRDPSSRVLLELLGSTTEQEFALYSTVARTTESFATRTRT
jgi:hypothetical protein